MSVIVSATASVSALMLVSMLENGYDADAWCRLSGYKSMWTITSVNADVDGQCGWTLSLLFRNSKSL